MEARSINSSQCLDKGGRQKPVSCISASSVSQMVRQRLGRQPSGCSSASDAEKHPFPGPKAVPGSSHDDQYLFTPSACLFFPSYSVPSVVGSSVVLLFSACSAEYSWIILLSSNMWPNR